MKKPIPWYLIFSMFIFLALANIFQKLRWSEASDNIAWEETEKGLICTHSPSYSQIQPNDILLTVNHFLINQSIDLYRIIENKNYAVYQIERQGIVNSVGIEIHRKFTPLSYYILVFCGIIVLMLGLGILNMMFKQAIPIAPPPLFLFLALSLSGFLIFSPTGQYHFSDFIYLGCDQIAYILFPSLLFHYSLQYPRRTHFLRKLSFRWKFYLFYLSPTFLILLFSFFLFTNIQNADRDLITTVINHFRKTNIFCFTFYLLLALSSFVYNNMILIIRKHLKKYLLPLIGTSLSLISILIINLEITSPFQIADWYTYLAISLISILPFSIIYFLSQHRFTDIELLIKRTFFFSLIFIFVFGIYLFLGLNIEQNKILGIFWSIAAILLAGLLFKPIESTIQRYFERFLYRDTFHFRKKLKELGNSINAQRDLTSLSTHFLDIVNHGFEMQNSALIIHYGNNIFYSLPDHSRLFLSQDFRQALFAKEQLVFLSDQEFQTKFPKDFTYFQVLHLYQFLPLKISNKTVGIVAFGKKHDQTYLSVEDWEIIGGISSSLALAVENAFLYSRLENQLREMNLLSQFNRNIIENINLGIVVVSSRNRIKTWNRFMEEKIKIKREQAINKPIRDILGSSIWEQINSKKTFFNNIINLKIPSNENELIFDISISPLESDYQISHNRIILFEDVTQKNAIQQQLIMSEKMASLGMISASVAHEINTPLTGISSYCQMILHDQNLHKENREMIQKIQDQVIRANKIVRNLLDFSRQTSEKPIEINLDNLIDESLALIEHKLKRKDISIRKQLSIHSTLYGYPAQLQQMFINLILNAYDSINQNGIIVIWGEENDQQITFHIKDNGKGIPEKFLNKIFDPFFTTKEIGKGTGLGLSIVYNITKEHYGDIRVHSIIDQGTTFVINLPKETPLRRMRV